MRLLNLEIHNLRGIQNCSIDFPADNRFICLIGSGDGTKSTVLLAIEWLFNKTWNLAVCDNDFYNGRTENDIVIRGTFSEFPEQFMAEDKFGMYLRKPGVSYDGTTNDEPEDSSPLCLTIQLIVDSSLEPHWTIVCNRTEPKPISNRERSKLAVECVGENCAKDLTWGRYSILQKYADAKGILHDAYTQALRAAADRVKLEQLDELSSDVADIGNKFGVGFESSIQNKLLIHNGTFSASAGLYEGNIPLNLRGLGSQRLLSMGLNISAHPDGTVLLIDEVEHGLEPYRLRSLINKLRSQSKTGGQVIITTHSPVVLTECSVSELAIAHSQNGTTTVYTLNNNYGEDIYKQLQQQIRSDPDAFLSKVLIVCEGKTEQGFVKSLDDFMDKAFGHRLAYKGVGIALGGGENTFKYAKAFLDCGYPLSIFMDSDKDDEIPIKEEYRTSLGISIFDWAYPNSIEQQLFLDLPDKLVQQLLDIAVNEKGIDTIHTSLDSKNIPYSINDDLILLTDFSIDVRQNLGSLAKQRSKKGRIGEWYKRIDLGRMVGDVVFDNWSEIDPSCQTYKTIGAGKTAIKNLENTFLFCEQNYSLL